jgi:hypothetical protein
MYNSHRAKPGSHFHMRISIFAACARAISEAESAQVPAVATALAKSKMGLPIGYWSAWAFNSAAAMHRR